MKLRKSDHLKKKARNQRGKDRNRLRNNLRVENLEKRELLAFDAAAFAETAFFFDQQSMDDTLEYLEARFGGAGSGTGLAGEGGPNDVVTAVDSEPNNTLGFSQLVPLAGNFGVNIGGDLTNALDEDWFAVDLPAGAILDARLIATGTTNPPQLTMTDNTGRELVSSNLLPGSPPVSPLTGSGATPTNAGDIALHYIIPEAGRYHFYVAGLGTNYQLQLRQYRPVLEQEDFGTKQILFLDFDGGLVQQSLFGVGTGTARMSPTRSFLPQYGIQDSDYGLFVDEVVARVQSKFDYLAANSTNPNFGIEIRNSKDHADPWGLPNVSRVVIGGTWQELLNDPTAPASGILGIAESVDGGNFDTTETAVVMHDQLIATYGLVPIDSFARPVEVIAELMTFVIAHEAGHFFGGRHQYAFNAQLSIMDQMYDEIISSGSGPDGIFGSADDVPVQFEADVYTDQGEFAPFGTPGGWHDAINTLAWGLTSGGVGASTVRGRVFTDHNANSIWDPGDLGFPGVTVYADANLNGVFDAGEQSAVSNTLGEYQLLVGAGTHVIREVVPAGYRLTTAESRTVTTTAGGTVANVDFGNAIITPEVTGRKWNDANGNGLLDIGEPPIEGVWIYIDADGDNRIDIGEPATQTAADGTYKLNFFGPGTYTIREVIDGGFVQTFPGAASDFEHTIVLTGDPVADAALASGLDFGNRLTVDFGDAPESYGSASHGFVDGLILGQNWDSESGSQFSSLALGDDVNGATDASGNIIDDEDGVLLTRPLVAGSLNNRIAVTAQNTTGGSAFLSGWIDFDQSGTFEATERVITNAPMVTGTNTVTFAAPANAALGSTVARFRYSATPGVGPTGAADSGEVEDYVFTITDTLDLAVDDRYSVTRNSILNLLPVLDNDFQLPGETLEIISVSTSLAGATIQVSPNNEILYTPPSGFIGQDSFTYTMQNSGGDQDSATVIVDVNLAFENPLAIDDSFNVATNVIDAPLNVLANDIEGQNGALTIISITQPDKGGQLTIATGGKSLRYTPQRAFGGTEFFTYTVADASGSQSSATVTVHTLPGDQADDDVLIELVATDLDGNPISAIEQGQDFKIQVNVDDLRHSPGNPGTAAGLFSAYFDLLYNLQLVSTIPNSDASSSFSYDVEFLTPFDAVQTGDATIPGIIDEFGAVNDQAVINEPNPQALATITFNARSPGIASFMPDPADEFPAGDTLLFDTPGSAVPIERIRFIGTQIEIVGDGVEFPLAVDDSVPGSIQAGTIRFPVDVMANDLPGSTNSISIIATTDGQFGTTQIDTRGTATTSDDRVFYTPNAGFQGTDQFTYTIEDARGIQSTARVTLRVGNVDGNDDVALRLDVTDENGTPIEQVAVGEEFWLRGFVEDLRGGFGDRGVFAAYEDILYNAGLVSPVASTTNDPNLGFRVNFGPSYQRVLEGDIRTPGLINEIGAVQSENNNMPLGSGEFLLFEILMTANAAGVAEFIGDPADVSPFHDTLTFDPPAAVPIDRIQYGFDSITIVAAGGGGTGGGEGLHNYLNPFDVNDDSVVSPLDVLIVIHRLNSAAAGGEGESGDVMFVDVDNNGYVTPKDALLVINHLNGGLATAEGEGLVADLSAPLVTTELDGTHDDLADVTVDSGMGQTKQGRIGSRMTQVSYGPVPQDFDRDSIFDDSEEDLEDLFGPLLPGDRLA